MANTIGWGQAAVNNTIDWGKGKTNNTIGWGTIYSSSPYGDTDLVGTPAGDADALAFISAAAITDSTQKRAIDKLVVDLKGYGIWSKMKALYPFVGGTAASHKWNLKNPLDTDAAFRLTFSGGWTHSANGALPNGTNAYADTFLIPNNVQTFNSNSIGAYSGNVSDATVRLLMGSYDASTMSVLWNSSTLLGTRLNLLPITSAISGDSGLLMSSKTDATNATLYKNSTSLITANSGGSSLSTFKILLGTMTFAGNPYGDYSISQFRLAFMADGFNSTEQANLYTAVQAFQTTLSRNV
jgi:hypothetical protein